MRYLLFLLPLCVACTAPSPPGVPQWNVRFELNDSTIAEVRFEGDSTALHVVNDTERIPLESVGPGLYRLPVFGGSLSIAWKEGGFSGHWVDSLRTGDYRVPFSALPVDTAPETGTRTCNAWNFFASGDTTTTDRLVLCTWGDSAAGTVASPTGDLRFLAGTLKDGILRLSTFDGAHLYAFQARSTADGFVDGVLYSGIHGFTQWHATAGDAPAASAPTEILLDPSERFAARTAEGADTVLSVVPPPGKIHLISIAGTWCPNCMDEARMVSPLLKGRPDVLWSVVLFERDSVPVPSRLAHWARSCTVPGLPFVAGSASKERASSVFPWIPGGIQAFPTTAVVRDDGSAWIHVGFDGPATGAAHDRLKSAFINALAQRPTP